MREREGKAEKRSYERTFGTDGTDGQRSSAGAADDCACGCIGRRLCVAHNCVRRAHHLVGRADNDTADGAGDHLACGADTVSDDAVRPGDHIASAGDYRASRIHNHFAVAPTPSATTPYVPATTSRERRRIYYAPRQPCFGRTSSDAAPAPTVFAGRFVQSRQREGVA